MSIKRIFWTRFITVLLIVWIFIFLTVISPLLPKSWFSFIWILSIILLFFSSWIYAYNYITSVNYNIKILSLIAVYSVFVAVSRIPFNFFPSVQPCSFLIFCSGIIFGKEVGYLIGVNTAVLSNMVLGQGPYTLFQAIAWGIIGICGGIFSKIQKIPSDRNQKAIFSIILFFLGLVFGFIMNIWSWLTMAPELSISSYFSLWITGIIFDLAHSLTNLTFFILFGKDVLFILERFKIRFLLIYNDDKYVMANTIHEA